MSEKTSRPRHVVITGAGGALGWAVVQHFLDDGARLALIDRHADQLAEAYPGLDNSQHLLVAADVTSESSLRDAMAPVLQAFKAVDVLVHIAGGFEMGEAVHELSRDTWDRMMNLNAWSFVVVAQSVLPAMMAQGSGKVIAVTAKSAARGTAAMSAYVASKSALQRLVESMAAELAPHGINVNSVAPSTLDTPANRQAMPDANPADWVSTAVAAQTIGFLASAVADALHGQHLTLDT